MEARGSQVTRRTFGETVETVEIAAGWPWGAQLEYVPLTDVWPQHGLVSIVVAALEDAGFHPEIECDPRGWMHFYSWPQGSLGTVTVWIPEAESADAAAFLRAPADVTPESDDGETGFFWAPISRGRRLVYLGWLVGYQWGLQGILGVLAWLYAWADRPTAHLTSAST